MFESDGKKRLKKQYNRMQGMARSKAKDFKVPTGGQRTNSVYGELKLSEQLHDELDVIRYQVDSLKEELEETLYEKECLQKEMDELKQKYHLNQKTVENQKREIMQMRQLNHETIIKCEQIIRSS